ncbi:MAG TPA: hypothetical protein VK188_16085 [Holophaga sp.]|nr:hypothetical protein [Holophaga sp.]
MKTLALMLIGCGALLAQAPLPVVAGKDLKQVPGPLVTPDRLHDLAPTMGASGVEVTLRRSARRVASVPAVAVPPGDAAIEHAVSPPTGWQAYQVEAAPGTRVKVRLRGDHEGWFVVRCVSRMGQWEKGMLQNVIPTGNPEASFINDGPTPRTAYFVVDTTVYLAGEEPYTLQVTREPLKP